ncbi:hypothetical protein [Sphingomonas profundi]|uniref:hypothetical protein n=1 Tax=Alterirhizorhabdus profundi TaxID=2681549 RepID=UPI0012E7EED2|nr:hypothetical protein [Sphingomonas profundi]
MEIMAAASAAAFGRPLVTNVLRGLVVEAIVAAALCPSWRWCSQDYHAWDFERADGLRLEVKQSAMRQSWESIRPSRCAFDIAERTGRWDGAEWIGDRRRWADLYIFALHEVLDASADHRDPQQWSFYVVGASRLPHQQTIGLRGVRRLGEPCRIDDLAKVVHCAASSLETSDGQPAA